MEQSEPIFRTMGPNRTVGYVDRCTHAKSENMILVTNNVREFERVPELEIENWAE